MSRPIQGLIIIGLIVLFIWALRQPTSADKREKREALIKSECKHRYDSLLREYEKLAMHYRNMKRSRDVIKQENDRYKR